MSRSKIFLPPEPKADEELLHWASQVMHVLDELNIRAAQEASDTRQIIVEYVDTADGLAVLVDGTRSMTGNLTIAKTDPTVILDDDGNSSEWRVGSTTGVFTIQQLDGTPFEALRASTAGIVINNGNLDLDFQVNWDDGTAVFLDGNTGDFDFQLGDITTGGDIHLDTESGRIYFNSADDAYIEHDGDTLKLVADNDVPGDSMDFKAGFFKFRTGLESDVAFSLVSGTGSGDSEGSFSWIRTGAFFEFQDDLALEYGSFLVFSNALSSGIKLTPTAPTWGWADIIGDQFSKNTGGTKPTLATYNGTIDAWQFSDGDEAFLTFHIPHDYAPGTDIYLHVHWSQTSATATGGTIDFEYFAIYARGHNQNANNSEFTGVPITASFSSENINDGEKGLTQYQHHVTEVIISGASATGALFDRDYLEADGIIELTLEMDANNLSNHPGPVLDPFIHCVDIHYQTTGLIGTKSRTPGFT